MSGNISFAATTPSPDTTDPLITNVVLLADGKTNLVYVNETVHYLSSGPLQMANSSKGDMTYVSGNYSNVLVYYTASEIYSNETTTLAYTQPGNGWQDAAGNKLDTTNAVPIANNSTKGTTNYTYIFVENWGAGTTNLWTVGWGSADTNYTASPLDGAACLYFPYDESAAYLSTTNLYMPSNDYYGYFQMYVESVGVSYTFMELSDDQLPAGATLFIYIYLGNWVATHGIAEVTGYPATAGITNHVWWHWTRSSGPGMNDGTLDVQASASAIKPATNVVSIANGNATYAGNAITMLFQAVKNVAKVDKIRISSNPIGDNPD